MLRSSRLAAGFVLFACYLLIGCRDQTAETVPALGATFKEKWRYSSELIRLSNGCPLGDRGTILVTDDNRLMVVPEGLSYPLVVVPLDANGGADKTVGNYVHPNQPFHVTVEPGTKPRKVTYLDERSLCGYRAHND